MRQAFNNLARQDNSVMKSIALLTMIFLPATFISVWTQKSLFFSPTSNLAIGSVQHNVFQFWR